MAVVHHSSCCVAFRCWCVAVYQTTSHAARHILRVVLSTPRPCSIKVFIYFTTVASSITVSVCGWRFSRRGRALLLLAFAVLSSTLLLSAVCLFRAASANGCTQPSSQAEGPLVFPQKTTSSGSAPLGVSASLGQVLPPPLLDALLLSAGGPLACSSEALHSAVAGHSTEMGASA